MDSFKKMSEFPSNVFDAYLLQNIWNKLTDNRLCCEVLLNYNKYIIYMKKSSYFAITDNLFRKETC